MNEMVRELINYRELLFAFTKRNILIKYKQTFMGLLWAVFLPIIIVFSGVMVRKAMAVLSGFPLEPTQIASVALKSLPWAFFVGAVKFAVGSLIGNMNLVTKIYFPRVIFPLSYVLGQFFDFMVTAFVLTVIFAFCHIGFSIYILWLPILIIMLFFFTAALSIILACGNLFYRDVKHVVDVILTFGIFFTPVFYDASMFSGLKIVLLLNPVGAILENMNTVVIHNQPPELIWIVYAALWSFGGFCWAWKIFQDSEPKFAENI